MAHGDGWAGKWRGKMWMEWVASSLALDDRARSIQLLSTDPHSSTASSRLNWHPRRFKWTRPFCWKTKSGFFACAITFRTCCTYHSCGPGGSVGIATELRAGRSGIESQWEWDFPPIQTGPGAHPASCKVGTGSFPGVKCGGGVLLTTHPLLVPRSWKSRAIPLPTFWATPGL